MLTETGSTVAGSFDVVEGELSLRFPLQNKCTEQDLRIVASTAIEDVAGNNFLDPLDHVVGFENTEAASTGRSINLSICMD